MKITKFSFVKEVFRYEVHTYVCTCNSKNNAGYWVREQPEMVNILHTQIEIPLFQFGTRLNFFTQEILWLVKVYKN
jgi:hypothetical protein